MLYPMIRSPLPLLILLLAACPLLAVIRAEDRPPTGHIVFESDFAFPEIPKSWRNEGSGTGVLEAAPGDSQALAVTVPERGNHMVSIPLPLDHIRGFRVAISGQVKADRVSKPAEPWNGVKLMLHTVSPKGPDYQGLMDVHGSFDWKELALTGMIPPDATEASVMLGLQDSSGKVLFDDLKLSVFAAPRKRPASQPGLLPPEQLDRRTDLPRLRGVMYGPEGKEEDLLKLAEWKGNLIRWQFYWYDGSFPEKRLDLDLYDKWLEKTMAGVDRLLPLCETLGIRVVIDLHTPPGAVASGQSAMFQKAAYQKKFIEVWDRLATHYKDQPAIWGYDLLNEPSEAAVADGLLDWRSLAALVAKRIRAIDPKRAIIVEPGPNGGWGNLAYFEPINVPGIIYSVHMYDPLSFTHQGVMDGNPIGPEYPGTIGGVLWNKEKMREMLEPVRQYQKDYNVPVFIGEFSAIRWAPGDSAARYLRDCIEVFEEFGWDWAYHAFREWHGWNVEIGPDRDDKTPSPVPTTREKTLREGFSKNKTSP